MFVIRVFVWSTALKGTHHDMKAGVHGEAAEFDRLLAEAAAKLAAEGVRWGRHPVLSSE